MKDVIGDKENAGRKRNFLKQERRLRAKFARLGAGESTI